MKAKTITYWLMAVALTTTIGSCSEDGIPPTSLDATTITTKSGPGTVTLYWNIPDSANYYYVRVNYSIPDEGERMKSASVYSDSLQVDNLLARYGAIDFAVCTVSRDGTEKVKPITFPHKLNRQKRLLKWLAKPSLPSRLTGYTLTTRRNKKVL